MVAEETQRGLMELQQQAGGFIRMAGDLISGDSFINSVAYVRSLVILDFAWPLCDFVIYSCQS